MVGIISGFSKRVWFLFDSGKTFSLTLRDNAGNSFTVAVKRSDGIIRYESVTPKNNTRIEGVTTTSLEDLRDLLNTAESLLAQW